MVARTEEAETAYLVIGPDFGFKGVTSYYLGDISVNRVDTSEVSATWATQLICCSTMLIGGTRLSVTMLAT